MSFNIFASLCMNTLLTLQSEYPATPSENTSSPTTLPILEMINLASINMIGEKRNVVIYSLMSREVEHYIGHVLSVSFMSQPCLLTHSASAVAAAKGPHTSSCCCCLVTKSCPTLGVTDPINYSPPGFSIHGISQARILK